MNYNPDPTIHTFATLRIVGDALMPDDISKVLRWRPTKACQKGDAYSGGEKTGLIRPKSGFWYISTENIVESRDLSDHLKFILFLIAPDVALSRSQGGVQPRATIGEEGKFLGRLSIVHNLIKRRSLEAVVTCFWHGRIGAKPPAIPRAFRTVCDLVPIRIETDFDIDTEEDEADRQMAYA